MDHKPSILFVDAIEDSVIKIMNRPVDLQSADMTLEESRQLIQKLQKKVYVFRRRIIQLLSANAEERYSSFVTTYPNLVQRVPQKMIASYLGITPESLSRVRKELVSKK
jgi:CRP/FNR family transcriptional regulator, anaerobic regulatory protein